MNLFIGKTVMTKNRNIGSIKRISDNLVTIRRWDKKMGRNTVTCLIVKSCDLIVPSTAEVNNKADDIRGMFLEEISEYTNCDFLEESIFFQDEDKRLLIWTGSGLPTQYGTTDCGNSNSICMAFYNSIENRGVHRLVSELSTNELIRIADDLYSTAKVM